MSVMKQGCARSLLPLLTLGFPLGVVLVVVLRLPVEEVTLASTDMRLLAGFSSFWCGWQEVTSTHPFFAYKVPGVPPVVSSGGSSQHHQTTLSFRFSLIKGRSHLLRFHLLPGSTVETSGCSSAEMAVVHVAGGEDDVIWCWKRSHHEKSVASSEEDDGDSSSEEESNPVQFNSPEMNGLVDQLQGGTLRKRCPDALSTQFLEISTSDPQGSKGAAPICNPRFNDKPAVNVSQAGLYYVIASSHYLFSVNHILLHVRLNRSTYRLPDDMILCRSQSRCEIPLSLGASERVVVYVAPEPDAGTVLFPIRSKCKPRVVFYLVVFLFLPLMFAVSLAFAVRTARKNAATRTPTVNSITTTDTTTSNTTTLLLPPSSASSPLKPEQMTPPPPYHFVCDPPPPYESPLVRQMRITRNDDSNS